MINKFVKGAFNTETSKHLWLAAIFSVLLISTAQARTIESVIPGDSLVYLKLQNLKECREAIESSENWKEAAGIISAAPQWQPMNQFMQMLPMFTGTDIQGLIETFLGGQIAVTVSPGAEGLMVGIVIENRGTLQQAEQILFQLIGTLSSMVGNPVQPEEGDYQGITYHTAQLNTLQLTYGSINETLLLVGITPGSFEKMIDTYKAEEKAITESTAYRAAVDKFGKSEVFAFVNVEIGSPYLKAILPSVVGAQLDAFQTLTYSWELLQPGGTQQLSGTLKNDTQGTLISLFQEPSKMQAIQGLSGDEEFFLTTSPSSSQILYQTILGSENDTTLSNEKLISFLIPDQTDLLETVTGELVISADLSFVTILDQGELNFAIQSTNGEIGGFKAEFPEMDLGVIFNPASPAKWQALFNGLLEKLSIESPQQFDYKGKTFNTISIPGTLYYGNVNKLFVLAFSKEKYQSIVDNLLDENLTPFLKKKLERLPANPACLFQLNVEKFLPLVETEGIPWWRPEIVDFTQKIGVMFASFAVGGDTASLELTLSREEKPINAVARLAPIIFFLATLNQQ
ncbi:MAG: hypothetical protein OXU36_09200 [Candidatus Poribacteria bacterium]|nr:hypothetical protein [Candidatus Poribacteria bacterium]